MFLNYKFGFPESQDYAQLPGFKTLTATQQHTVHETYRYAYRSSMHLGMKTAMGMAHENAKAVVTEMLKTVKVSNDCPPSIFAGLDID